MSARCSASKIIVPKLSGCQLEGPGHVDGDVEHPEEGGQVEVVHEDGQHEAVVRLQRARQHVG